MRPLQERQQRQHLGQYRRRQLLFPPKNQSFLPIAKKLRGICTRITRTASACTKRRVGASSKKRAALSQTPLLPWAQAMSQRCWLLVRRRQKTLWTPPPRQWKSACTTSTPTTNAFRSAKKPLADCLQSSINTAARPTTTTGQEDLWLSRAEKMARIFSPCWP